MTRSLRRTRRGCGKNARSCCSVRCSPRVAAALSLDFRRVLTPGVTGSGESGKSTIVKQMKIIHLKGYSQDELASYRPTVYKNLLECAKALCTAMRQFEIEPAQDENRAYCEFLLDYSLDTNPQARIDPRVGVAIEAIWNDPAREQLMERQTEFYLMDSAE